MINRWLDRRVRLWRYRFVVKGLEAPEQLTRTKKKKNSGRNGGHLTPNIFLGFRQQVQTWGLEDAKRQILLENYTVSEITKLLKENDLEGEVDLVAGGHVDLSFTEDELHSAKLDYKSAKQAGINLTEIEWLNEDETYRVSCLRCLHNMITHICSGRFCKRYGASYPGFFEPGHNLWPSKLVTHLLYLAQKSPHLDLHLFTTAPVTRISKATFPSRKWTLETSRGNITTNYIIHATNAYASYLIPSLSGPEGIIPTRGQVIATRASVTAQELTKVGWGANEGFEYWFPRPVDKSQSREEHPLIILGGGRESGPDFELYQTDDGQVNPDVGKVLRKFLPEVFPDKYELGKEPEMEWVSVN
jgi:glycine/D-amino acid oxidase-like deaminating enzyme